MLEIKKYSHWEAKWSRQQRNSGFSHFTTREQFLFSYVTYLHEKGPQILVIERTTAYAFGDSLGWWSRLGSAGWYFCVGGELLIGGQLCFWRSAGLCLGQWGNWATCLPSHRKQTQAPSRGSCRGIQEQPGQTSSSLWTHFSLFAVQWLTAHWPSDLAQSPCGDIPPRIWMKEGSNPSCCCSFVPFCFQNTFKNYNNECMYGICIMYILQGFPGGCQ